MVKRTFYFLSILSVLFLVSCSKEESTSQVTIDFHDNEILTITTDSKLSLEEQSKYEEQISSVANETKYTYDILKNNQIIAKLSILFRTLNNEDTFIFTRLSNNSDLDVSVDIDYLITEANRYVVNDFDTIALSHEHDGTLGVDLTTYPIGLFDFFQADNRIKSIMVGKNYVSVPLEKTYGNDQGSFLRELVEENKNLTISYTPSALVASQSLSVEKEHISEQWMLVSNESLFLNEQNLTEWISYQQNNYKHTNKWYTEDGPFKKLPWSIEPFTEMGYGRNLGNMMDQKAFDFYLEKEERYFYDLTLNAVVDLLKYQDDKESELWETEYTSTWLKKAYGTKAPYIDTRQNEKIAKFLLEVGKTMSIPNLSDYLLIYGDYLVQQVEAQNIITIGNGYLIADYYTPLDKTDAMTHTSVNHALGGFNILLDCYFLSGNEKYLNVAKSIHNAFSEIGKDLIRPNGDLWYQINPDLTFSGTDYEQLTLIDLLDAQDRWLKAGFSRSKTFDLYIGSKYNYLKSENKSLYDEVLHRLEAYGFKEKRD